MARGLQQVPFGSEEKIGTSCNTGGSGTRLTLPRNDTSETVQQRALRASEPENIGSNVPLEAVCADPFQAALVGCFMLIDDSCPTEPTKVATVD